MLLWFFMAVAATSLLPAVYFIKISTRLFNSVYLGYIFVSLGIPAGASGGVDWVNLVVVYCMVCLFVAFSKSLCFNPVFILFGYGYYRVKTSNNVKVFVITKRKIRKSESKLAFPNLRKINELVYLDMDK